MNDLTINDLKNIISRVIENANEAVTSSRSHPGDLFEDGRSVAYYEVLDTIKSELNVRDVDVHQFGLDINLEAVFL